MDVGGTLPPCSLPSIRQELDAVSNGNSIASILATLKKACAQLESFFSSPPTSVYTPELIEVINSFKKALTAIDRNTADAASKVVALTHPAWNDTIFSVIESCCFSEQWHAIIIRADTSPDTSLHSLYQSSLRDFIRDGFVVFLSNALATFKGSNNNDNNDNNAALSACVPHLAFLLHLASVAANRIGWRDPCVLSCPQLRNYGLLNALWVGVVKCWGVVDKGARATYMEGVEGLTASSVVGILCSNLASDLKMLCMCGGTTASTSDVKLLLFWLVNIGKIIALYPTSAPKAYETLTTWGVEAQSLVAALPDDGMRRALEEGSIWVRVARVQAQALGYCEHDGTVEALINATMNEGWRAGQLPSTSSLLSQTSAIASPKRRAMLMPVFKRVLQSLKLAQCASAVQHAGQCQGIADACLHYIISLASCAAEAPGVVEECMCALMEEAVQPHPATYAVLSSLLQSLVVVMDTNTTKQLISGLYEIVAAIASARASASALSGDGDTDKDPVFNAASQSPSQPELLLSVVLAAAPNAHLVDSFCSRYLVPSSREDAQKGNVCQVAVVAAVMRSVACSGRASCCSHHVFSLVQDAFQSLSNALALDTNCSEDTEAAEWLYNWLHVLDPALQCLASSSELASTITVHSNAETALLMKNTASILVTMLTTTTMTQSRLLAVESLSRCYTIHKQCLSSVQIDSILHAIESISASAFSSTSSPSCSLPVVARRLLATCTARLLPTLLQSHTSPPKKVLEVLLCSNTNSPCLYFIARDAYIAYARGCAAWHVVGTLPQSWLDPQTGYTTLDERARPVVERYLHRQACGIVGGGVANYGSTHGRVSQRREEGAAGFLQRSINNMKVAVRVCEKQKEEENDKGREKRALVEQVVNVGQAVGALEAMWKENTTCSEEEVAAAKKEIEKMKMVLDRLLVAPPLQPPL